MHALEATIFIKFHYHISIKYLFRFQWTVDGRRGADLAPVAPSDAVTLRTTSIDHVRVLTPDPVTAGVTVTADRQRN